MPVKLEHRELWPSASDSLAQAVLAKPTTHPNIFRKRIQRLNGNPKVGDYVAVYHPPLNNEEQESNSDQLELLGYGLYNPKTEIARGQKMFDVVVLDPPKLIRNRSEIEEGTRKHFDLNRLAMQLVKPGGLMLTCSCAGLLPVQEFTRVVRAAARSAFRPSALNPNPVPRQMQMLAHSGPAACHPVSANCPETEYFKSILLRL